MAQKWQLPIDLHSTIFPYQCRESCQRDKRHCDQNYTPKDTTRHHDANDLRRDYHLQYCNQK